MSAAERETGHDGITVTGRGIANAPADHMRVTVRLYANPNSGSNLGDVADAVVSAMHTAGIRDAHSELPLAGSFGPNVAPSIVGTIDHPTREVVEGLARATTAALPDRATKSNVNYNIAQLISSDDCGPAETRAQQAAIADARARAQRVAHASGVRLGDVVAVNEGSTFLPGGCPTSPDRVTGFAGAYTDPLGALAVPITVNATVTFAIR